MRSLVIHPDDASTAFLAIIYEGKGWTVPDVQNISKNALKKLIIDHDRIIMLGHGTASGLINGYGTAFKIDSSYVYLLRDKICVCVWCNSDEFVEKYKLKGFYTGMIISEEIEANLFCVNTKTNEIATSNVLIAEAVGKAVEVEAEDMVKVAKDIYVGEGEVFEFNRQRIYHTDLVV